MSEIYVSIDIEADGPIPGPHSMLSFGAAAFTEDKKLVSTFEANLELLEGAAPNPSTAEWWKTQPEAWAKCRENLQKPEEAMPKFVAWVKALPGRATCVAYPAGFDFMFVYWYLIRFAKESPFSFSCFDIKSYATALVGLPFRDVSKRTMPQHWFEKVPHTHVALDDAKEQGLICMNMIADRNKLITTPPVRRDNDRRGHRSRYNRHGPPPRVHRQGPPSVP